MPRNAIAVDEKDERRTQAERRSDAETALLDAGLRIVAAHGFERFTLSDVGEVAGYSRGLPRHYFGTKEQFVARLADRIVRQFGHAVSRAEMHPPGLERLLGICRLYLEGSQKSQEPTRALFAALGESITNPPLREAIRRMDRRTLATLEANIRAGIDAGEIRAQVDPRVAALLILSQLRGSVSHWLIDPSHIDLKSLGRELIASVKRSLVP